MAQSRIRRIFSRHNSPEKAESFSITGTPSRFTAWSGDAYASDIYRGAVDAIARNAAKLKGRHVVTYEQVRKPGEDNRLDRLLQVRPNPYMSAYDLLYKLVTHCYLYNNAFAILDRDGRGSVRGIYPVNAVAAEFIADPTDTVFIRFRLRNGNEAIFDYSDVIHIRRDFNSDDLFGDDNGAISAALELAHTQDEGIVNGIKSGASIRGILRFEQILSPEKLEAERDHFIADYLDVANDGGVVVVDQKMSYQPIESKPAIIDDKQLEAVSEKIYSYLGITAGIVSSSYTEDEWAAFYESVIEPLAVQLSLEFTEKVFSSREQAFGNSVVFESNRLQFASNSTKADLIAKLVPYGLLSINQALEILNLPPVADGDRRLQTLNVVSAEKADDYQLSDKTGEDA